MGALMRATREEVEELVRLDPEWWPGFCAALAERGQEALKEERDKRGWSWGALWKWIVGDVERYRDYMQALEAHVQMLVLETVGIADGASSEDVAVAKLKIDTRLKVAGKLDRERWGERVKVEAGSVVVLDAGLVGFAGALLERLSRPEERPVLDIEQVGEVVAEVAITAQPELQPELAGELPVVVSTESEAQADEFDEI